MLTREAANQAVEAVFTAAQGRPWVSWIGATPPTPGSTLWWGIDEAMREVQVVSVRYNTDHTTWIQIVERESDGSE